MNCITVKEVEIARLTLPLYSSVQTQPMIHCNMPFEPHHNFQFKRWAPIYIEVDQPLDTPGPTRRPPDVPSYVCFQPKLTYPIFDIGQSRGFWSLRRGSGQGGPQFISKFINPLTHQDQPDDLRMCTVTSVFNQS